ncbi:GH25 family lysozyme M1 (1,4-beta-N-acetylmuramidase) [Subtercola boreus]|nr:GH25 family lysozyme M1 (1,4-beta-N-acetylmuramidase) [Subtercola boreus]
MSGAPVATASPAPDAQPTLEQQNAAHDHVMGATLAAEEPQSPSLAPQSATEAREAAAPGTHVLGMDVSGWQPDVDWNTAWANGARFVYIKTTESNNYASSHFSRQWSGATDVGMVRGAYHFANPFESTGAVQANWFVDHGGRWSPDGRTLPPMLDIEYDPYTGEDHTNSCYGLSQAVMVAWIREFSNTVLARTGVLPTIYSTTNWWRLCTGNNSSFGANPLFIARWPESISDGAGTLPAGWSDYSIWQYASAGTFPGDQDLFNGDYSKLHLFASNGQTPAGGPSLDAKYISALYQDYLGRLPSDSDINFWEGHLATGSPRSIISSNFVNSDEYRLKRIDAAYRDILGRTAEEGGRQNWLYAMQHGGITTDDIETTLYSSQEYYLQHGNSDTSYATALYNTLLSRAGSSADYAFWAALVAQHGRAWVIDQFWNSTETISKRVAAMYDRYLGRQPDAGGLKTWVALDLRLGDSGVRGGLTSSEEYFGRAQSR